MIQNARSVEETRTLVRERICIEKRKLIKMKNGKARLYQRGLVVGMKQIYDDIIKLDGLQEITDHLKDMETDLTNIRKIEVQTKG